MVAVEQSARFYIIAVSAGHVWSALFRLMVADFRMPSDLDLRARASLLLLLRPSRIAAVGHFLVEVHRWHSCTDVFSRYRP